MSKAPPGKIVTRPLVDGLARFAVITDEAAKIKRITPVPTVWGRKSGRPIYDRLPGVSEAYRLEYFGEEGSGFVYVDPQFGTLRGPGSLEIGSWEEDPSILLIQSGTITWKYGQVPVNGIAVDLRTIVPDGVQDGDYQVGYYLGYDTPSVTREVYEVEDYSLASSLSLYGATSVAPNSPVSAMFSDVDPRFWKPNIYGEAGVYSNASEVFIDFSEPVKAESFSLQSEITSLPLSKCALYRSDDGVVWYLEDSRAARNFKWNVIAASLSSHRYWKLFFWDGFVSVDSLTYTGEAAFRAPRPVGPIPFAEPFLEGKFDPLEDRPYIRLGEIEVKNQKIVSVTDSRRTTSTKYEPVAAWLTTFQDESLRELFTSVEKYSTEYMSPITGADKFYASLEEDNGFTLGSESQAQFLKLPSEVELKPAQQIITNAEIRIDPVGEALATDPSVSSIVGENIPEIVSSSVVTPSQVILLGVPEQDSDLATKAYVDKELVLPLDNGVY